jgi:hypothetical protein
MTNEEWMEHIVDYPYDLDRAILVGEIPTAWDICSDEEINGISEQTID